MTIILFSRFRVCKTRHFGKRILWRFVNSAILNKFDYFQINKMLFKILWKELVSIKLFIYLADFLLGLNGVVLLLCAGTN